MSQNLRLATRTPNRSGSSTSTTQRLAGLTLTPRLRALPPRHAPRARARRPRPLGAPSLRPAASPLLCRPQRPSEAPRSSSATSLHGLVRPPAARAVPRAPRWHLWPWGGLRQVCRVETAEGGPGCALGRLRLGRQGVV